MDGNSPSSAAAWAVTPAGRQAKFAAIARYSFFSHVYQFSFTRRMVYHYSETHGCSRFYFFFEEPLTSFLSSTW